MNTRVPVVVLYRGGNGAVAIARTLGRLGVPVYLVSKKKASAVEHSRYWAGRFWWDFSAPHADTLQFLLSVGRRIGTRAILLTLADWAAIFIEQNADALRERFILSQSRPLAVHLLSDKWQMFLLAKKYGIPTPDVTYPRSRDEVLQLLRTAHFPYVMKAADPFLPHVPSMEIVYTARDLLQKFDRETALGPANLILQEYIPGEADSVWMCNAYFGRASECRAIFTGKKLRQVSATGIASLGVCLRNDTIEASTKDLIQAAGYEGALDVGYRYDARDDLYKLLDVNPRVGGAFRLFRATNGMDVVRICYLDLTGQPIPDTSPSIGRKWMLEEDIFSALSSARSGKLTFKQWLQSLQGIRETHWFAADDPAPGFVWLWRTLWELLRTKMRRMVLVKG